ncbi:MAG: DUF3048 domain-containing protein [Clostridium sp.]
MILRKDDIMIKFKFLCLFVVMIILGVITYSYFPVKTEYKDTDSKSPEDLQTISQKYYSNYTGLEISKSEKGNTPFMVMIENSNEARPQSGLSSADIIFETNAEGGIPRFMALFQSEYPETIGPVRSVRPYYLTLAKEQNIPFAHCGGSQEALNEISSSNTLMSLNEISNGKYFWRDTTRKAPHNLYTSSTNVLKAISDKKWLVEPNAIMTFNNVNSNNSSLTNCNSYSLKISNYYNTNYIYNGNKYEKSMNGELAIDSNNNKTLSFTNVVIQKASMSLQPDNIHINIDMVGEGTGQVLRNGKIQDVKWRKDSPNSKTILTDYAGNEVSLSPGKTIWHIVDTSTNIQFK